MKQMLSGSRLACIKPTNGRPNSGRWSDRLLGREGETPKVLIRKPYSPFSEWLHANQLLLPFTFWLWHQLGLGKSGIFAMVVVS